MKEKEYLKNMKPECNIDNKNMIFLNDLCKFDDKKKIGGFKCMNGKWNKSECKISNCNF